MLEKSIGQYITDKYIVVYGWYYKDNLGDDLFIDAFRHLFPSLDFLFVDEINPSILSGASAVIFGGGSFLFDAPNITSEALKLLDQKPIYYIGVGVEAEINTIHQDLMKKAKLIAIRNADKLEKVKQLNQNTICVPDLVYALHNKIISSTQKEKRVLIIPNVSVVPTWSDPYWKHAAWSYFKSEFCQFIDYLIENEYQISFLPMCRNDRLSDIRTCMEIINGVNKSHLCSLEEGMTDFKSVTHLLSKCDTVVTQRFHGIVLSEITRTPYIALSHHDKLSKESNNPSCGAYLSYYGLTKNNLIAQFSLLNKLNYSSLLPIETNIFESLTQSVLTSLSEMDKHGSLCRD